MSDELDNAAVAALWPLRLQPKEKMGALFGLGSAFGQTPTIDGNAQHVKGTLAVPPGSLAALFHNHPGKPSPLLRQFSPDDISRARQLKKPSYITTPDGTVMKFDPTMNTTNEVLAEFPIDQIRERYIKQIAGAMQ